MIDHILLGGPQLSQLIEFVFQKTQLKAMPGGAHPNWNTHNALLSLDHHCYLELISPLPGFSSKKPFEILSALTQPKIITWAANTSDIQSTAERINQLGMNHSGILGGSRLKQDGNLLTWKILFPEFNYGGVLPFFIQWDQQVEHPAMSSPPGLQLNQFLLSHPEALEINKLFQSLKLNFTCQPADEIKLELELNSPSGIIQI